MNNKKLKSFFSSVNMFKLGHFTALVLFFVILAFGITGYGMTKGFISLELSRTLHLGWLGLVGLVVFIVHTFWGISLSLRRKNKWNKYYKTGLIVFYILLTLFFLWLNFFYNKNSNIVENKNLISTELPNKIFTFETLKNYDGKNGQPAYVAIDGVVYDMSSVFVNGVHHGYTAGKDLSSAFHGEHPDDYLKGYKVVGSY